MKRTPWWLTAINAGLLLLVAFASYFKALPDVPTGSAVWIEIASAARSRSADAIFWATVAVIVVGVIKESITVYQWRKDRVQRVLGKVVKHLLDNDVRENRCTLFQAVSGWRAFVQLSWRALFYQDVKWPIFRELFRIKPWGKYLIVYARPAGAPNDRSCALFRVYRTKTTGNEGVAGKVWESDEYTLRGVTPVPQGKLSNCRPLNEYSEHDPVRRFAEETNMQRASQLRARERAARHYHGTVITTSDGSRKWGVLLIDSFNAECPFPVRQNRSDRGAMFLERFRGYAETLSTMLT